MLNAVKWRVEPPPDAPILLSGMALGVDQIAISCWIELGHHFVAVVPFPGQESRWPKPSQRLYKELLTDYASGIVMVSEVPPRDDREAKRMMLQRDDWVCAASDELAAVFDGSPGGTGHTVATWRRREGRALHLIDPRVLRVQIEDEQKRDAEHFASLSRDEQLAELFKR